MLPRTAVLNTLWGLLQGQEGSLRPIPPSAGAPLLLKTAHKGFGPMAIRVMLGGYTDGKRGGAAISWTSPTTLGDPAVWHGA